MKRKTFHALGIMSGSSLDGLDIAFCKFDILKEKQSILVEHWELIKAETIPFSALWVDRLTNLPHQNALVFAQTNTYFGYYMGELVNQFLEKNDCQADFIASHGHTIFHIPQKKFTAQIGDGAALAGITKLPVICNFRAQDVALNGEGAPVAPIADKLLFKEYDFLLNLGGIANISCNALDKYIAFDLGACNQVFNALAKTVSLDYDEKGEIASRGTVIDELFEKTNALAYFSLPYPKSLSNQWVQQKLVTEYLSFEGTVEDKMRTASEQLAYQTAKAFYEIIEKENLPDKKYKILSTGGGAKNLFFMENLKFICEEIGTFEWVTASEEIIDFKEAILMVLMGVLRIERVPNVLKSVTGASRDTIGGGIYLP